MNKIAVQELRDALPDMSDEDRARVLLRALRVRVRPGTEPGLFEGTAYCVLALLNLVPSETGERLENSLNGREPGLTAEDGDLLDQTLARFKIPPIEECTCGLQVARTLFGGKPPCDSQ